MRLGFLTKGPFTVDRGGLDAFLIAIANEMVRRGHECLFLHPAPEDPSKAAPVPLHPSVRNIVFPGAADAETFLARAGSLVRESGIDLLCVMYSAPFPIVVPRLMRNSGIPVILSEHLAPGAMENRFWSPYERRACLAGADAIHMIFDEFAATLPDFLRERATVIPLPAMQGAALSGADWERRENAPRKILLSAGRLVEGQKNHSLLIRAFMLLADDFPDWDLRVYGEGADRAAYEAMAAPLIRTGRASFPGRVENLDGQYAAAHLFCLSSLAESFGLVTVEAQRFALPVAAFASASGTNHIVRHGVSGLLAPENTPESLAETLAPLMRSAPLRKTMGLRGQELLSRFEPRTVFDAWEKLFTDTEKLKGRTRLMVPSPTEEEATVNALREILARDAPEIRPACARQDRRLALIQAGVIIPRPFRG